MENCFEIPQEKSNFQDNSCRIKKLRESYLILKQKICKSHELIQRYNDKIKECERLKTDLATANNEVRRMAGNYNTSLAKVIRIELQNTEYKKKIELLESKVENYETKMLADQNYIQQLICKMKETHRKHAEKVAKYDLKASTLQGTVTELRHDLAATKKICERRGKRTMNNKSDGDEDAIAEKKCKMISDAKTAVDVGVNTVDLYPKTKLTTPGIDVCTLTDEFYNTNDNPYPLFCEKCEVLLHPPPLEKICCIMKECPRIVEEFTSPLSTPPETLPRLPPSTPPPPATLLRSISFPQAAAHNNPAHSTPVSSSPPSPSPSPPPPPPPPPPPIPLPLPLPLPPSSLPPPPRPLAMKKVVDQRPLVRMLMKRVNRLEMRIDAQNTARNQIIDSHCRSVCLRDTITSVSDFFREVTRIAAGSRGNSKSRSRISKESQIRVSRSHTLRPKVMTTRSRLPLVSSCSGVWEVNSLKKIQNEKGNKVRKRDIRKSSNVSSKMVRIVQREIPMKSAISKTSLHSLSESEVSDSLSFSYDTLSDNNENKTDISILSYDEDSSINENEIYNGKVRHPVITFDEARIPSNDVEGLENYSGYQIPREELFTSGCDTNDAKSEGVPSKSESAIDSGKINSYNGIKISSDCPDISAQRGTLTSKPGDNIANNERVSINNGTEKDLSGETSIVSDRLCIEPRTSDSDNEMSPPPAKMPNRSSSVNCLNVTENSAVDLCERGTETGPPTEFTISDDRINPPNEGVTLFVKDDTNDNKINIPFRSILVPIRRSHRHNKVTNCMQSENSRQGTNLCDNSDAMNENGGSECFDVDVEEREKELGRATRAVIKEEQESHQPIENGTNERESNESTNFLQGACENGDISKGTADGYDLSMSASPIEILQNYIRKKEISGKIIGTKQNQKKKLKKKLGESRELTDVFVKKQFQKLIDNEWELFLHNDILEKLSKACGARIIAKLSIEFLSELTIKDKELDRTHTPPAPLMTREQQKMITLMIDLDSIKPGVIRHVLAGIQYKLFRLNYAPEREIIENLGRVYVVLARVLKDRQILRIFCCDALYCLGLGAISIIYTVLTCWPEVFPVRRENVDILPKCIAHFILQQKAVAYFPKLLPLKNLITGLYTYSSAELVKADLLRDLLSNLESESQNGLYTAIILFAKREGLAWTYKNIVRDGLLPMIIGQRHPNVYAAFCLLGNLMRSFPVADTDGTVSEIVDQLCDLMKSGEGSDEQQEGVASALLSLSRHRFESVAQSVLAWQSKIPLRQRTAEQLKVLFDSKPIDYWRSFLKKKKNI